MRIVVSPYHLTTREPVAMACLLLADSVVTLLPNPVQGLSRDGLRACVKQHPEYLRMLESWRWSEVLWRAGIIESAWHGLDAEADVRHIWRRIADADQWKALRTVVSAEAFGNADQSLERLCVDVLKGGPNPCMTVSVAAGLDAFAAAHGLVAARAGPGLGAPGSISQRAEALLGQCVCAIGLPVLLRADGQTILRARAEFEPELRSLRESLDAAVVEPAAARVVARVRAAAIEFARAFDACRDEFTGRDDSHAERVTAGFVSMNLRRMPADSALLAALAALRTVGVAARRTALAGPNAQGAQVLTLTVGESVVQPARA